MKERLLISACFLGRKCKYNGGHNALPEAALQALVDAGLQRLALPGDAQL